MSHPTRDTSPSIRSISLDQLIALNDEMAALARMGMPLESGLMDMAGDLPGNVGKLASTLGKRMAAGQSLEQVISQSEDLFPPFYQAAIRAGVRSGRLAVALESLSSSARRVALLRRLIGVSLLYPLIVLSVAYTLFVFVVVYWVPVMLDTYDAFDLSAAEVREPAMALRQSAAWWVPVLPLVVILGIGIWWYRSGRAIAVASQTRRWFGRFSSLVRLLRIGRMATFAEVLALLVEQQVPMDQAVVLAADASGDRAVAAASRQLAEQIQRGQRGGAAFAVPAGFPPLLAWLIVSDRRQTNINVALRQTADSYRRRALRLADWLTFYLPMLLTTTIGGTATLLLAIAVFGPWFNILYRLAWAQ
jgi:type II secretory pathway component PulF